jgi:putative addiction module killer protein
VEATHRDILIYETEDGKAPFSEWMDSLEGQEIYGIIMTRLERVESGNLGEYRGVGGGVAELVIDFGSGYRVYFGHDGKELIILLAGGTKGSQTQDIQRAKTFWRNYNA